MGNANTHVSDRRKSRGAPGHMGHAEGSGSLASSLDGRRMSGGGLLIRRHLDDDVGPVNISAQAKDTKVSI